MRGGRRTKPVGLILVMFILMASISILVGANTAEALEDESAKQISAGDFIDKVKVFIGQKADYFFGDHQKERELEGQGWKEEVPAEVDYMLLVNKDNPVPNGYQPENMINIADYAPSTKGSVYLESQAANAYIDMAASMKEDGISDMAAVSGFRDYDYQSRIHNSEVNRQSQYYPSDQAKVMAARIVAAPGTSEHQLGLAIDVSSSEAGYGLSKEFASTTSYRWLQAHAHEYGFILRYPQDKTDITNVIYEPWHLRYVGDLATDIYDSGLCLEEYLNR